MTALAWILLGGLLMALISLVGSLSLMLPERVLQRLLLPLVALAAGTLLGGAFFHMIPAAIRELGNRLPVYVWILTGFVSLFALEQFLHWHHCHLPVGQHHRPLTYLILLADGLHNFIGGAAVAGAFINDVDLGITAWLAAAAHEVPQELGDFGILVHGGWAPRRALLFNLLSALTFLLGGLVAYAASSAVDVAFLLPFAAGNFIYIAAADLIPEVKEHESPTVNVLHFLALLLGLALLGGLHAIFDGS